MNKIEIAKAKVDYWKTWCTTTIALSLTSFIAYWQTKNIPEAISAGAPLGFAIGGILFLFVYLYCSVMYIKRYHALIDECHE